MCVCACVRACACARMCVCVCVPVCVCVRERERERVSVPTYQSFLSDFDGWVDASACSQITSFVQSRGGEEGGVGGNTVTKQ